MPNGFLILIADDDDDVRSSLGSLFRLQGYDVGCFSSCDAVLSSEHLPRADCILSDIRMPGESGLDLARRIRERGLTTPVILMTAFPAVSQRALALRLGVHAILTKPFDSDEVLRCVARAVAKAPPGPI